MTGRGGGSRVAAEQKRDQNAAANLGLGGAWFPLSELGAFYVNNVLLRR